MSVDAGDQESIEAFADQKATLALILAVCGFFLLPFIASLGAVVVAHQARRMTRGYPDYPRRGLVTAAMVFGYIGLVYGVAALVYVFG